MPTNREKVAQLAARYVAREDATGWFEVLYRSAGGSPAAIPWADMQPNPNFTEWAERRGLRGGGQAALVIGCGLGDDAQALDRLGFNVTVFDISQTAVEWCRSRFPTSSVDYRVMDLFRAPESWNRGFDFVLEAYTLQVLPPTLQRTAMRCIAACIAPGGRLLVIARGRDVDDRCSASMHWRLSCEDLNGFLEAGLKTMAFEDYMDRELPPVRRFRVEYSAAAAVSTGCSGENR